ncbi:DUF664 domain-containing protein [Terrabacter sp. NPDC000476]|uniref:mycothiol transferase n=1 Tax=Terrabacter sp. NPDC000476 TaxID=3154258 RepID=UPI003320B7CE
MGDELPEVVLTTTVSVDGRITLGRHERLLDPAVGARWSLMAAGGPFETRHEQIGAGAILEGSGSFVDPDAVAPDWPAPVVPDDLLWCDHLPAAARRWFVVADGRGRVDWSFTGDADLRLLVLVCRSTPPGYLQRLRDLEVGYVVVGDDRVDLRSALARLRHRLGVECVVADSGGTLNASLLREGLVDVVDVVTLPGLVGGAGTPTMMDGPPLPPDATPIRLRLLGVRVERDAVRTRYAVDPTDPEAAGTPTRAAEGGGDRHAAGVSLPFPDPTAPASSTTEVVVRYLNYFRDQLASRIESLSETDQRTSRLPSGWTPVELLNHLTHVERRWLEWGLEGAPVADPWGDTRDDRWFVDDTVAVADLLAALRAQARRSNEIIEAHALADVGRPGPRWDGAPPATLERVVLHLLQEYARHLGHLDIVSELAGGGTGE